MDIQCQHCDSFNFKNESVANEFTVCCNKGSTILPPLKEIPQIIKNLFIGNINNTFKIIFFYNKTLMQDN